MTSLSSYAVKVRINTAVPNQPQHQALSLKKEPTMSWSTVQENRKSSILRRTIVRRLESRISGSLSPIERWSDHNYAPQALNFIWVNVPQSYHIAASLHGFEAPDVHVDLSRGHVIILLSHNYDTVSNGQPEYYREIPIPPDAKPDQALVEVCDDMLMVSLYRKTNLFRQLTAAVARLGRIVEPLLEAASRPNQRQRDALSRR
jgi:hypothetical protein